MFSRKQAPVLLARLAGFLAVVLMVAVTTANAHTVYSYEKTIALTLDGNRYTDAGEHAPSNAAGAKGIFVINNKLYVPQNSAMMMQVVDLATDNIVQQINHTQRLLDCWAESDGTIYTVDDQPDSSVWTANGSSTDFTAAFPLTDLSRAYTLYRDTAGNFYCTDGDGPFVMYDSTGTVVSTLEDHWSYSIAATPDGSKVYWVGKSASENTDFVKTIGTIDVDSNGYVDGSLTILNSLPDAAVIGGTGCHYDVASDTVFTAWRRTSFDGDNQILRIDPDGNMINRFNTWDPATGKAYFDPMSTDATNGIGAIYGVCTDPDTGKVYVSRHRVYDSGDTYTNGDPRFDTHILVFSPSEVVPGDANADGEVDAADAAILASNWMSTGPQVGTSEENWGASWEDGDFNYDGVVNDIDATIMASNWTGSTAMGSVPEPSTLLLIVGGLLTLCFVRKRSAS